MNAEQTTGAPAAEHAIEVVTPLLARRRGGAEVSIRTLEDLSFLQNLAQALAGSRYFDDAATAERAAVKILAGQELGIGPVAALMNLHVIEGKVQLSANLMAATIKRHESYDYRVKVHDEERCVIEFTEAGENVGTSEFTMAEAERAGLGWSKGFPRKTPTSPKDPRSPWVCYPKAMLFARALSQGARWYAPDVFYGLPVYVEGELDTPYRLSDDEAAAYFGGDEGAAATVVEQVAERAEAEREAEHAGPLAEAAVVVEQGGGVVVELDHETGELVTSGGDAPCPSCNAEGELTALAEGPECATCGGDRFVPSAWVEADQPRSDAATERQLKRLGTLASDLGWDDDERHRRAGVPSFKALTDNQARELQREWTKLLKAAHQAATT